MLQKKDGGRSVAKKSAPSHFNDRPRSPPSHRSVSPTPSLAEKLAYIERKGIVQRQACIECQHRGLASHCVVAARISPRCGNCLRAGEKCRFPQSLESSGADDDDDDDEQMDELDHINKMNATTTAVDANEDDVPTQTTPSRRGIVVPLCFGIR